MTAGAAQPNALLQPTFHNGVLGGRPVVTFGGDASNQSLRVMASTTNQATYGDLAIGPAGITYFAVIRVTQSTVGVLFGDDNAICDFPVSTSQVSLGRHDGHYFSGRVTVPGDYTVFLRLAGTFSNINPSAPNLTTLYTNGVPSPTTSDINSALPIADLGLNIGADITDNTSRPHFGGDLAEMIIYNRMLSTNELRQVDAYLQNKYFSSLSIQISQVRLCWGSLSNRLYQVQYQSALTSNNWMNLGAPITGSGATDCATDSVTDERRVYRVLLLP
jgi:hypothetical protein